MHAGLADARMWDPLIPWFQGHEPVAYDLRGFGQMDDADGPWHHVDDLLGLLGDAPAVLVGASLGGRVALEAAVLRPDLVTALVLLAPGLEAWSWSAESRRHGVQEHRLIAGDALDEAAALNVRRWVVGPRRRDADVAAPVLDLAFAMHRRALTIQVVLGAAEAQKVEGLLARLAGVACPALVLVGEHDLPELHEIATAVAATLPGAGPVVVVPDAAHLLSLERPAAVGPHVERFLREVAL